jgi:hypothetical protein
MGSFVRECHVPEQAVCARQGGAFSLPCLLGPGSSHRDHASVGTRTNSRLRPADCSPSPAHISRPADHPSARHSARVARTEPLRLAKVRVVADLVDSADERQRAQFGSSMLAGHAFAKPVGHQHPSGLPVIVARCRIEQGGQPERVVAGSDCGAGRGRRSRVDYS